MTAETAIAMAMAMALVIGAANLYIGKTIHAELTPSNNPQPEKLLASGNA